MKYLIIFSLVILLAGGVLAEETYLKDVPEGHWATAAVYELVRLGVTRGYPDGTFRGKNDISRYEIATFLSKLAKSSNQARDKNEKLIEELRAEAALIKYKQNKAASETQFSGSLRSGAGVSTIVPRGGEMDYRLRLDLVRNLAEHTQLKVGLDTLDAGFAGASGRSLATEQLDFAGGFKLGGLNYSLTFGPGDVRRAELNELFPSENNIVYRRPKTAVRVTTRIRKLSLSGGYVVRRLASSGEVSVQELTGRLKYKFGRLAVYLQPHYVFILDGGKDVLAEVGLNYMLNKHWLVYFLLGAGNFQAGSSGLYVKVVKKILDPWQTGTTIVVRFDKVGSRFRSDNLDEYEFIDLNNFSRLILDGTADLGLKVEQRVTQRISAQFFGDYVTDGSFSYGAAYAGTYFLWQLGLNYRFSPKVNIETFYRSYNVPSGISQFSEAVPAVSEIIGVGLRYSFNL